MVKGHNNVWLQMSICLEYVCDCVCNREYDDATIIVMRGNHYNMISNINIMWNILDWQSVSAQNRFSYTIIYHWIQI